MRSQVDFGGGGGAAHGDGDGLELCPHAEKLGGHACQGDTDEVEKPPGKGGRQVSVPVPTSQHVDQVECAREVEAKLGPLHHVPQKHRAAKISRRVCFGSHQKLSRHSNM